MFKCDFAGTRYDTVGTSTAAGALAGRAVTAAGCVAGATGGKFRPECLGTGTAVGDAGCLGRQGRIAVPATERITRFCRRRECNRQHCDVIRRGVVMRCAGYVVICNGITINITSGFGRINLIPSFTGGNGHRTCRCRGRTGALIILGPTG